jgi:hypothetical protein
MAKAQGRHPHAWTARESSSIHRHPSPSEESTRAWLGTGSGSLLRAPLPRVLSFVVACWLVGDTRGTIYCTRTMCVILQHASCANSADDIAPFMG